jgi:cell division septation protein DedD
MQRGLGGSVFEPVQEPVKPERDREVTVGPGMLIALALGLFALCAFCFLFGYSVGHRGSAESAAVAAVPAADAAPLAQPASLQTKPSAGDGGARPHQAAAAAAQPDSPATASTAAPPDENPDPGPAAVPPPAGSSAGAASPKTGEPAIRAALSGQSAATRSASDGGVQPALGQSTGIMVQIAAVSQVDDADVLVGALRKRGYTVTSHRDPADGLLHVQVGPFANRNDAIAMRQKLLNDGYNAVIEQ